MPILFVHMDMTACPERQCQSFIAELCEELGLRNLDLPDFTPDALFGFRLGAQATSWVQKARDLGAWLRAQENRAHWVQSIGLCLHDGLSPQCVSAIQSCKPGLSGQFFWPQATPIGYEKFEMPDDLVRDFANKKRWPLALQPVHDFGNHCALYEEVLARSAFADQNQAWFVQGLEEDGQILNLDMQIIHRAIAALFENPSLKLGINASRRSFGHENWLQALEAYNDKTVLSRLFIEITETQEHRSADQSLAEICTRARKTGVNLILDDLGVGATSIDEIFDLPLSFVKLDKALVSWLYEGNSSFDLIGDLLSIGKQQGWQLIAEGAGDAAVLDFLRGRGVTLIQGFAIRRPRLSAF